MEEKKFCQGCEEMEVGVKEIDGYNLCPLCATNYELGENTTGYCSLNCIMTGRCDESC